MALQGAMGRRAESGFNPYAMSGTAARWSLEGAASDSTYLIDGSNRLMLVADRSGNSSTNGLVINGVTGTGAIFNDSAALSVTGDAEFIFRASSSEMSSSLGVFGKDNGATQRSYAIRFNAGWNSTISIYWWPTGAGASEIGATSTAATGFAAYSTKWIRVTMDVNNGSGGYDVKFYTSSDDTNDDTLVTWTQLGSTVTGGSPTSFFDSTSSLGVGLGINGQAAFSGIIYRAIIKNGLAGSKVLDANFTTVAKLAATFTESSSNAATGTIATSGDLGARISGLRDWYQGTQSKQLIYLGWSGVNYGFLNNASGAYFGTPSSSALSITGDFEIEVGVSMDDWTPATTQYIASKWDQLVSRSWMLRLLSTGKINFGWEQADTTFRDIQSTLAPTVSDFGALAIKVTVDVDNGSGGCTVTFYTATLTAGTPGTFTQLGSPVVVGAVSNITAGSSDIIFGMVNKTGTTAGMNGKIWYGKVRNGIGGTLALHFSPPAYTSGATLVDQSSNAATITNAGAAVIVDQVMGYGDGSNDYFKSGPFSLVQPNIRYVVGSQVTWTVNDYLWDGGSLNTEAAFQVTGTPKIQIYAGGFSSDNASWALKTRAVVRAAYNGASSGLAINNGSSVGAASVGSNAANGFTFAAPGDGTVPANVTFSEVLVRSIADDSSTQVGIAQFLLRKWRIAA